MPVEEYEKLTPEEIELQKEERFANWIKVVNTPQEAVEPTKEDLEAQQVSIDQQIESLQSQKVQLSSKLEQVMLSESEVLEEVVVK
jgi:peptidoglycan hydrolase CwlO-like protein